METIARKGTLSDAMELVSTMDIVDAFGVPNKTRRGRTYLLCPGHDDRHFGSCYIDKNDNGYYCYVCGEHVTKWQMVLKLNGNRKSEAYEWFFKMAGISPTQENYDDPYRRAMHLIRKLEKYVRNSPVYNDMYACDKIDSSYGRNINGEYLYSERVISNPLVELYKTNKQTFKNVVTGILEEEIKKVSRQMQTYEANENGTMLIEDVGPITHNELTEACRTALNNLETLIISVERL